MKIIQSNKKTKTPTDEQIEKMFEAIKNFQKSNIKYLLLSENRIAEKSVSPNIFTTNNTNN